MSRAFRETFKQTFCSSCYKGERRDSMISFAYVSQRTVTKRNQNQTIMNDETSPLNNANVDRKNELIDDELVFKRDNFHVHYEE